MKAEVVKRITGCLAAGVLLTVCITGCGGTAENKGSEAGTEVSAEARGTSDEVQESQETAEEAQGTAEEDQGAVEEDQGEPQADNEIFELTFPEKIEGKYVVESYKNGYSVYDKESREGDFGGYAFSVYAYGSPKEFADGMSTKVGEIIDGDKGGVLYDVVMYYPSDVQYDIVKYGENMPETYETLYRGAEDIVKTLKPFKGTFVFGSGCKGEDLYPEVIAKHVKAAEEGWDANKYEAEDMSPEYGNIIDGKGKDGLSGVGIAYVDINRDGIDELLVGDISAGNDDVPVYDVYTMVDRKPAHVISGSARDRYYPLEYRAMVNEGSNGADESEWVSFDIEPDSTVINYQVSLKMDGYENKEKPWFVRFGGEGEEWENITEEDYNMYMGNLTHLKIKFTPISDAAATGP